MLLWHGSRLTNWVGIISQGLRIAPPEAPVTGYMVCYSVSVLTHFEVWNINIVLDMGMSSISFKSIT